MTTRGTLDAESLYNAKNIFLRGGFRNRTSGDVVALREISVDRYTFNSLHTLFVRSDYHKHHNSERNSIANFPHNPSADALVGMVVKYFGNYMLTPSLYLKDYPNKARHLGIVTENTGWLTPFGNCALKVSGMRDTGFDIFLDKQWGEIDEGNYVMLSFRDIHCDLLVKIREISPEIQEVLKTKNIQVATSYLRDVVWKGSDLPTQFIAAIVTTIKDRMKLLAKLNSSSARTSNIALDNGMKVELKASRRGNLVLKFSAPIAGNRSGGIYTAYLPFRNVVGQFREATIHDRVSSEEGIDLLAAMLQSTNSTQQSPIAWESTAHMVEYLIGLLRDRYLVSKIYASDPAADRQHRRAVILLIDKVSGKKYYLKMHAATPAQKAANGRVGLTGNQLDWLSNIFQTYIPRGIHRVCHARYLTLANGMVISIKSDARDVFTRPSKTSSLAFGGLKSDIFDVNASRSSARDAELFYHTTLGHSSGSSSGADLLANIPIPKTTWTLEGLKSFNFDAWVRRSLECGIFGHDDSRSVNLSPSCVLGSPVDWRATQFDCSMASSSANAFVSNGILDEVLESDILPDYVKILVTIFILTPYSYENSFRKDSEAYKAVIASKDPEARARALCKLVDSHMSSSFLNSYRMSSLCEDDIVFTAQCVAAADKVFFNLGSPQSFKERISLAITGMRGVIERGSKAHPMPPELFQAFHDRYIRQEERIATYGKIHGYFSRLKEKYADHVPTMSYDAQLRAKKLDRAIGDVKVLYGEVPGVCTVSGKLHHIAESDTSLGARLMTSRNIPSQNPAPAKSPVPVKVGIVGVVARGAAGISQSNSGSGSGSESGSADPAGPDSPKGKNSPLHTSPDNPLSGAGKENSPKKIGAAGKASRISLGVMDLPSESKLPKLGVSLVALRRQTTTANKNGNGYGNGNGADKDKRTRG